MSDYHAVNLQIEESPGAMPPDKEEMGDVLGATFSGKLDLLLRYWHMPLAKVHELFTIATPSDLYNLTSVPQGASDATSYFQGILTRLLCGLKRKMSASDVLFNENGLDELLAILGEILETLQSFETFAAAHKCSFSARETAWRGEVYSSGQDLPYASHCARSCDDASTPEH